MSKLGEDLAEIAELVRSGVLGHEEFPEPNYWSWPVLKPEALPEKWRANYERHGKIKW